MSEPMDKKQIETMLDLHRKWLYYEPGGERANLEGANLQDANLQGAILRYALLQDANLRDASLQGASLEYANLRDAILRDASLQDASLEDANLQGASLRYANLQDASLEDANLQDASLQGASLEYANLQGASLRYANLRYANLGGANLQGAILQGANLHGANLQDANLQGAILQGANLQGASLRYALNASLAFAQTCVCPQKGAFTGFKKAYYGDYGEPCIVELEIPADAKRSNASGRKCRASKARVVSITDVEGNPIEGAQRVFSGHNKTFTYSNGVTVEPTRPFDDDRWEECAPGIHFFITREEAVAW